MKLTTTDFLAIGAIFLAILLFMAKTKKFFSLTYPLRRRKGVGDFGAYRSTHPTVPHRGQDFLAAPGQLVYAAIDGRVRIAMPYPNDARFSGVEIIGTGKDVGYKVKAFYIQPTVTAGQMVKRGDLIGVMQDLSIKYGSIANHTHVEVRVNGEVVNPTGYFKADTKATPITV